ncbi:XVIPCD domain-containing protein [Lysobacter sp. CA196]|uniref:XVIPCD domain-containing protein n=1 Tax=Lysobacter sp. CA196 TaxID=3455606 RepID=UPI003F8D4A10
MNKDIHMAASHRRADTHDIAALLASTDSQGRVDQLGFEAQRLILRNQKVGGVDAAALVNDLQRSPALRGSRDSFLDAVDERLETSAEKRRFAEALDAANITDSYLERQGERVAEAAAAARDGAVRRIKEADQALSDLMGSGQRKLRGIVDDPQTPPGERAAAAAASALLGTTQYQTGLVKGAASHAAGTLGDFVDLAQMADRLATDKNYRDMMVGMAKMYAADVADDPSKPLSDAQRKASDAMESWEKGFKEAWARGAESEYLGGSAGVVGVEIVANLVPGGALAKFGKAAKALDAIVPEHAVELSKLGEVVRVPHDIQVLGRAGDLAKGARGLTDDAVRAAESAEALREVGETLGDMSRGLKKGGDLGEGAEQFAKGLVRNARENGDLEAIIKAAHATDNVEGLLRSGQLSPKELGEAAKLDQTIFQGRIDFQQAMGHSLKGVDLKTLSTKQLGDIGEALQTYDMVKQGYTDIISIKNRSGHGIDVVGRHPQSKELEFFEVKTSATGQAVAQRGMPSADFVESRLNRAAAGIQHWAGHNTIPGLKETAQNMLNEIVDPVTLKVTAKSHWVQINISNEPGSLKLKVDEKISTPWAAIDGRESDALPTFARLKGQRGIQEDPWRYRCGPWARCPASRKRDGGPAQGICSRFAHETD